MGKVVNARYIHLAEITEEKDETIKFGTPEKVLGFMKATRAPQVASGELYEDGVLSVQIDEVTHHNLSFDFGDLPMKWRAWINGLKLEKGVISDSDDIKPKPFAIGWELIKSNGTKQMIWYLYCKAKPIEDNDEQRTKDIKVSNDTFTCTALKKEQFKRIFTMIDTSFEDITEEMQENFFKKVQTTDTIEAPAKA